MGPVAILSLTERGIRHQWFTDEGKVQHEELLPWASITEVFAFKRDLFTYDLVCLQLLSDHKGGGIEVDEDDAHWNELIDLLPNRLPGCETLGNWYTEVVSPAFKANRRQLYQREQEKEA